MEGIGAASHVIHALVLLVVGGLLLGRGSRTHDAPQLWLSGYVLGAGLGQTLMIIPAAIDLEYVNQGGLAWLSASGHGLLGVSVSCGAVFVVTTFRPNSLVARVLATSIASCVVGGIGAGFAKGDYFGLMQQAHLYIENAGTVALLIWVGSESILYYVRMRRRRALGLADPVVTNRFAIVALFAFCDILVIVFFLGIGLEFERTGRVSVPLEFAMSLSGLGSALFLWLAFATPRAYQRWLLDRATA